MTARSRHDELRALAEAATPRIAADLAGRAIIAVPAGSLGRHAGFDVRHEAIMRDSAFVAACSPDVLIALLDELAAAEAEINRLNHNVAVTMRALAAAEAEHAEDGLQGALKFAEGIGLTDAWGDGGG